MLFRVATVCTAQDVTPVATFPIIVHDEFIGARVEHEGKGFLFGLHTGLNHHICDLSLEKYFGRPVGVAWLKARVPVELRRYRAAGLRVGGTLELEATTVGCADLAHLRRHLGENVRGVLGIGFFRDRVVQIAFDERELRLFRTGTSSDNWGERVELIEDTGHIYCQAAVGESNSDWFMVNTAAMAVQLEERAFRRASTDGDLQVLGQSQWWDWFTAASIPYGRASRFRVGSFSHRDKIQVQERNANCLGLAYLSRYLVTFDVSAGAMYLRPGARFDAPDVTNATGLHLWQPDAEIVVWSVDEQSPAARAGVQKDDVLVRVDRRAASDLRLSGVRRALRDIGVSTLTLELRRGNRALIVPLSFK